MIDGLFRIPALFFLYQKQIIGSNWVGRMTVQGMRLRYRTLYQVYVIVNDHEKQYSNS